VPGPEVIVIIALAGAAAFTQSVSGFGFSLFIVPPLALAVGAKDAVVLANTLSVVVNLVMATRLRGHVDWRLGLTLLTGACAGMPLGLLVLVVVMLSAVLIWRGVALHAAGRAGDLVTGLVSGVLNTSTSMSGPPVVLYLQGRGVPAHTFRATLGAYFLASGAIATGLFVAGGRFDRELWADAGLATPALVLGWFAGNVVYGKLDAARFRGVVIVVLVATAAVALATAVTP
jgi:hypothetical protein